MDRLTTISLFSGCGGSDLGAKMAGADIIFANDISRNAVATYRKYQHLMTVPGGELVQGDVSRVKAFPDCDLLMGCYPCQSFTMGGRRDPESDRRSLLFREFRRCLIQTNPKFFVVENVGGIAWLRQGTFLRQHIAAFESAGKGYLVSWKLLNAKDFGVPADRKRVFIVGVKKDIALYYHFLPSTHGIPGGSLEQWRSHGDAIAHLWPASSTDYYHRLDEPFPWWYLSRNRKRPWDDPSYTISANWRHVPLHPASPTMHMVKSNLSDGWKQWWEFTEEYDHVNGHFNRPRLEQPRRLTWRECAAIQTFPDNFEPVGSIQSKYKQIGNAVPPLLMEAIVRGISEGSSLRPEPPKNRKLLAAK